MRKAILLSTTPVLFLLLAVSALSQTVSKQITLEDIYKNRRFSSKGVYGINPMANGDHYCQVKKDSLNVYSYESGKFISTLVYGRDLVPAGDTVAIEMGSFQFSTDEKRILFATDEEPIYRRSSKATYYIYDIESRKLVALSQAGKQRLATFSPDGSNVAFVRDNNLFIADANALLGGSENPVEKQITTDGRANEVINGATDWVYEEEFEFSQAFFWSPDGKRIAYYRFDERAVKEYQLTYYGDLYPEQYRYKYPKAGEDNSLLSIHVYDLSTGKTLPVDIGNESDIYIPRIKWTANPSKLALYRMNRHQNHLELLLADAATGKTQAIYTEDNKYYIEITDHWEFLKSGEQFLITSEKDGFRHIYLYDMNGHEIRQITKGQWEVTNIAGVDEKAEKIFFLSTESSPMGRDLFSIGFNGKDKHRLSRGSGTTSADFSSGMKWYLSRWSDLNTPPYYSVCDASGKEIRVLQNNAKLKETISEYGYSKAEFFTCKTTGGIDLNGVMLKPPDFDAGKKYPVLFTIYGGPGSQTVNDAWGTLSSWNQLWAQKGIIVVSVDNRGTGGRGEEFKKCTYLELGKFETEDQIAAARYLTTLPYVDEKRIGMWGWSFGGYLTLSCLTKGADQFSFGIAVAPVTNWKYYDNIYTERFMRTPKENNDGYETNSPVNHAAKLKGKLLMIHGMADDNVHPQNAYDMVTALVGADKQFETFFYPNSNHGIYSGKNTTFHLYRQMTNFILDNL